MDPEFGRYGANTAWPAGNMGPGMRKTNIPADDIARRARHNMPRRGLTIMRAIRVRRSLPQLIVSYSCLKSSEQA